MQRWEYYTEIRKYPTEEELDALGADGWELVAIYDEDKGILSLLGAPVHRRFIFKRPLAPTEK